MKKRDITILGILSLVIGLLYVSGLPMGNTPSAVRILVEGIVTVFFAATPVTTMKPLVVGIIAVVSVLGGIYGIVLTKNKD